MNFERPRKVRDAQMGGNARALSAMGRKGAEVTNRKKAEEKAREDEQRETWKDIDQERKEQEEHIHRIEANEHVVPIYPEENKEEN